MQKNLNEKSCWTPKDVQSRVELIEKQGFLNEESYRDISHISLGKIKINDVEIPKIDTTLKKKDKLYNLGTYFGINRNNYMVKPGLYAIGNPKETSPVIVSCNYKLTFDIVRNNLKNTDCFLLILETNGVNVWCAAGKGAFGTEELLRRIKFTNLEKIVSHKVLIVPQLGASGINTIEIRKSLGYRCIFSPIKAEYLEEFIKNKFKAEDYMRKVQFSLKDRALLTPLNLIQNLKYYIISLVILLLLNFLASPTKELSSVLKYGFIQSVPFLIGLIISAIVFPIILPILPFRSFSLNGFILSLILSLVIIVLRTSLYLGINQVYILGYLMLLNAMMVNVSLSFTGSTNFTSFSGVVKETLWTLPSCIIISLFGLTLAIVSLI